MATDTATIIINNLFSLLLNKISVPTDFHGRVKAVKEMLEDDVSGLVDSLTDYQVNTASVDFTIESSNADLAKKLNKWLEMINSPYKGQIPRGIKPLAEEYFKERWKSSSFPILKIGAWDSIEGLLVPTKLFFVDGGSVYAQDKEENKSKNIKQLLSYDYYLGEDKEKEDKLEKGVIITKPYGRWYQKFPVPYLIKRGIYHNYRLIKAIKDKQGSTLEGLIPYLLLIKKGSEALAKQGKTYSDEQMKAIEAKFQELIDKLSEKIHKAKTPARTTQFDEEITHLIPDILPIFKHELFINAEKNILSGLGFIDVVEAVSTSRRESILNPKAFIKETKKGVEDFKDYILQELIYRIKEQNKNNRKYFSDNTWIHVGHSPIVGFITDEFKQELRILWKHGQLSDQTYCEMVGEVEFRTEVERRKNEAKNGTEIIMYPHITDNREDQESFEEIKRQKDLYEEESVPEDENNDGTPKQPDKIDDKDKFKISKKELITAPYKNIKDLPSRIKDNMSPGLQRTFLNVFNDAYEKYGSDERAFRIAWGVIKRIGKQNKNGKWVRKRGAKLNKAMLEEVLEKEEEKIIGDTLRKKEIEIAEKKNKLLDKLLNKRDK